MEFVGTAKADTWTGSKNDFNDAQGYGGNDKLTGGDNLDYLYGGDGADTLKGAGGDDYLFAENDEEYVPRTGDAAAVDHLSGGDGNDLISIGYDDFADGGSGSGDVVELEYQGAAHAVSVDLSPLAKGKVAANGAGVISGVEQYGTIDGSRYADHIKLGDLLATSYGDASVNGGGGNDTLTGGAGANILFGQDGNDHLSGLAGNDVLQGGSGDDTLAGGDGGDRLFAGESGKHLGPGHDVLNGGAGDDWIEMSSGGSVDGGAGIDTLAVDLTGGHHAAPSSICAVSRTAER